MPWKLKSAGVIGIAASLVAAYLIVVSSWGGSVAFAHIIDNLREARTLSFDAEIKSVADGKVLNRSRSYYMVPGKHRNEMRDAKMGEGYVVFDSAAGKVLMVDAKNKTAMISEFKSGAGNDIAAQAIEGIRALRVEDSAPVGEKTFGDVRARGFEFDSPGETSTVWTSIESGDLVRIEILHKDFKPGPVVSVWTNIQVNEQLDAALFSLKLPPGYTVKPFLPIDMTASPANYVAGFLKIYGKHMDGKFPSKLEDALADLQKNIEPPQAGEALSDELAQVAFYGAAVVALARAAKQGEQWQYFPDVKPGDKDKIVFWLLDKRKKEYSAVFGDLRVESVAEENLPPAPAN